jgi:excisionase family DNA binding protein
MTIDDLAAYIQISKSSLYKLAQDGRVPGQKIGKHWRFSRAVIDQWLGNGAATAQDGITRRQSHLRKPEGGDGG